MRTLFSVLALATLLGCSQETMRGPEGPLEYREGYAHGCESALAESGIPNSTPKKDDDRYSGDPQYHQGWEDGYSDCATEGGTDS